MRIAVGQMTSSDSHAPNIETLKTYAAAAADGRADMLCLPEVAGLMNRDAASALAQVGPAATDPYIAAARAAAAEHGLWIHAGSTPVTGGGGDKFLNHSVLIRPDGEIAAAYDKIHLFDVRLDGEQPIGESKRFDPGSRAVLCSTPFGMAGLTICYDVRFPHLYRALARAGACLLFVPSAFTVPTGRAHWEILLRARAIENGAYVVAAAQVGHHADGRRTWGHSMVVGPWGDVILEMGGDSPGLAFADLDQAAVDAARAQIPALSHDRAFRLDGT